MRVILILVILIILSTFAGCDSLGGVTSTQIEVNGTKYNVTVADNTTTTPTEKEKTKTTVTPKVENDEKGRSALSIDPKYFITSAGILYATNYEVAYIDAKTIRISHYYRQDNNKWFYFEGTMDLDKATVKIDQMRK